MLVAFTSHASERRLWPMEGCYWLARTLGPAFAVPASQVHASDYFEEGWLVVKCQWYKVITTSPRCYKLLAGEKLLVVSEMIRDGGGAVGALICRLDSRHQRTLEIRVRCQSSISSPTRFVSLCLLYTSPSPRD